MQLKWAIRALVLQMKATLSSSEFHESPLLVAKSFISLVGGLNEIAQAVAPLVESVEYKETVDQLEDMAEAFHELMMVALARELSAVRAKIEDPAIKPIDKAIAKEQERTYARLLTEGVQL